jgi:HAD superfamily hydrolase (TIGR01509 family)
MMGMSAPEWSGYLHDELSVPFPPQEINDRVIGQLLACYEKGLPLLPGAVAAVRRLAEVWKLGLASSANRAVIDAVLAASGLAGCFAVTVSGEEVAHGKPAPDVYLAAAGRLGVDPGRCAAVEDSSNGLRSAAAAGMAVIAVPNRTFPPTSDALGLAALTVDSLEELTPSAIASMAARRRAPA